MKTQPTTSKTDALYAQNMLEVLNMHTPQSTHITYPTLALPSFVIANTVCVHFQVDANHIFKKKKKRVKMGSTDLAYPYTVTGQMSPKPA